MCIERTHRLMMATLLTVCLVLLLNDMVAVAMGVIVFMIAMLAVWAVFDFCPALKILSRFMKPCEPKCATPDKA